MILVQMSKSCAFKSEVILLFVLWQFALAWCKYWQGKSLPVSAFHWGSEILNPWQNGPKCTPGDVGLLFLKRNAMSESAEVPLVSMLFQTFLLTWVCICRLLLTNLAYALDRLLNNLVYLAWLDCLPKTMPYFRCMYDCQWCPHSVSTCEWSCVMYFIFCLCSAFMPWPEA